jgi:hypothetical protein
MLFIFNPNPDGWGHDSRNFEQVKLHNALNNKIYKKIMCSSKNISGVYLMKYF